MVNTNEQTAWLRGIPILLIHSWQPIAI